MTDDLVTRLRARSNHPESAHAEAADCIEADAATIADLRAQLTAMTTNADALAGLVENVKTALKEIGTETGYCCCGDPVESHGLGSGHSPVDSGDDWARSWGKSSDAALAHHNQLRKEG